MFLEVPWFNFIKVFASTGSTKSYDIFETPCNSSNGGSSMPAYVLLDSQTPFKINCGEKVKHEITLATYL